MYILKLSTILLIYLNLFLHNVSSSHVQIELSLSPMTPLIQETMGFCQSIPKEIKTNFDRYQRGVEPLLFFLTEPVEHIIASLNNAIKQITPRVEIIFETYFSDTNSTRDFKHSLNYLKNYLEEEGLLEDSNQFQNKSSTINSIANSSETFQRTLFELTPKFINLKSRNESKSDNDVILADLEKRGNITADKFRQCLNISELWKINEMNKKIDLSSYTMHVIAKSYATIFLVLQKKYNYYLQIEEKKELGGIHFLMTQLCKYFHDNMFSIERETFVVLSRLIDRPCYKK